MEAPDIRVAIAAAVATKHMRGRRLRRASSNTKLSSSGLSGSIENPPPPSATMCLAGPRLPFLKFFSALVCTVD
jgi:hypothetical protein